ncbi:MAG TPA: helix-turn-helix domain-containing protein [Pseudobdellovibrionaceae bacterium]
MQVNVKKVSDISKLVRELRHQKGLSQEKASALAGVGRRFFSELERGEKESLDLGKVLQVLRKFGVKLTLEARTGKDPHDEL